MALALSRAIQLIGPIASALALASCEQISSAPTPTVVTTCELRANSAKYDAKEIAVRAVIHTDGMHWQNVETTGCKYQAVKMYFSSTSESNPCGDNAFAKTVECPLNALDWRIEATFIGIYHSSDTSLEVTLMKDITRKRWSEFLKAPPNKSLGRPREG
jgi:hypothetical protein